MGPVVHHQKDYIHFGSPNRKREKKRDREKKKLRKTENFPSLMKGMNLHI